MNLIGEACMTEYTMKRINGTDMPNYPELRAMSKRYGAFMREWAKTNGSVFNLDNCNKMDAAFDKAEAKREADLEAAAQNNPPPTPTEL